jgi:hypothetical protein
MPSQAVTLLFTECPSIDFSNVARRAEEIAGEKFDFPERGDTRSSFQIFHQRHQVRYSDGNLMPSSTLFMPATPTAEPEKYRSIIQQSWGCNNAEQSIGAAGYSVLMMEMMADGLEPQTRLSLFHALLQAAIEVAQPHVILAQHSEQAIDPQKYLSCCNLAPILRPGALNVRFFNIANTEGEMLMDTRGMTEIGLHDIQCHFRQLDPNDIIGILVDTAVYITENGAVIVSGQTIAGIEPGSKWSCQFEDSLIEPQRILLDLNPGADFAAGRS